MKYCKKIAKYNNLEPANTKDIIGIRPIYIHKQRKGDRQSDEPCPSEAGFFKAPIKFATLAMNEPMLKYPPKS